MAAVTFETLIAYPHVLPSVYICDRVNAPRLRMWVPSYLVSDLSWDGRTLLLRRRTPDGLVLFCRAPAIWPCTQALVSAYGEVLPRMCALYGVGLPSGGASPSPLALHSDVSRGNNLQYNALHRLPNLCRASSHGDITFSSFRMGTCTGLRGSVRCPACGTERYAPLYPGLFHFTPDYWSWPV